MLSQANINKLCMTGLYRAIPDKKIYSWYYEPYWCMNWTFKPYKHSNGNYYMVDTYYNNDKYIELTNDNFDKFIFIFDYSNVSPYHGNNIEDYNEEDYFTVADDSGGSLYCSIYLKNGAKKNKDYVMNRIKEKIDNEKKELKQDQEIYNDLKNGKIDVEHVYI